MVVLKAQCPSNFYGSNLPRPRIYTDIKFSNHRVDPPLSVTDPLMSWAQEAHWSMGGLSFKRLRLQGKIEGNAQRLQAQLESNARSPAHQARSDFFGSKRLAPDSPPPPPAPVAVKRRRLMALIEEEEEEEEEDVVKVKALNHGVRRRLVKKLGDDFDRVASENEGSDASPVRAGSDSDPKADSPDGSESMAVRARRSRRFVKVGNAVKKVIDEEKKTNPKAKSGEGEKRNGARTSPRLSKSRSN